MTDLNKSNIFDYNPSVSESHDYHMTSHIDDLATNHDSHDYHMTDSGEHNNEIEISPIDYTDENNRYDNYDHHHQDNENEDELSEYYYEEEEEGDLLTVPINGVTEYDSFEYHQEDCHNNNNDNNEYPLEYYEEEVPINEHSLDSNDEHPLNYNEYDHPLESYDNYQRPLESGTKTDSTTEDLDTLPGDSTTTTDAGGGDYYDHAPEVIRGGCVTYTSLQEQKVFISSARVGGVHSYENWSIIMSFNKETEDGSGKRKKINHLRLKGSRVPMTRPRPPQPLPRANNTKVKMPRPPAPLPRKRRISTKLLRPQGGVGEGGGGGRGGMVTSEGDMAQADEMGDERGQCDDGFVDGNEPGGGRRRRKRQQGVAPILSTAVSPPSSPLNTPHSSRRRVTPSRKGRTKLRQKRPTTKPVPASADISTQETTTPGPASSDDSELGIVEEAELATPIHKLVVEEEEEENGEMSARIVHKTTPSITKTTPSYTRPPLQVNNNNNTETSKKPSRTNTTGKRPPLVVGGVSNNESQTSDTELTSTSALSMSSHTKGRGRKIDSDLSTAPLSSDETSDMSENDKKQSSKVTTSSIPRPSPTLPRKVIPGSGATPTQPSSSVSSPRTPLRSTGSRAGNFVSKRSSVSAMISQFDKPSSTTEGRPHPPVRPSLSAKPNLKPKPSLRQTTPPKQTTPIVLKSTSDIIKETKTSSCDTSEDSAESSSSNSTGGNKKMTTGVKTTSKTSGVGGLKNTQTKRSTESLYSSKPGTKSAAGTTTKPVTKPVIKPVGGAATVTKPVPKPAGGITKPTSTTTKPVSGTSKPVSGAVDEPVGETGATKPVTRPMGGARKVSNDLSRSRKVTPPSNRGRTTPTTNDSKATPSLSKGRTTPTTNESKATPSLSRGRTTPVSNEGKATPPLSKGRTTPVTEGKATPLLNKRQSIISEGKATPPLSKGKTTPVTEGKATPPLNKRQTTSSTNKGKATPPLSKRATPVVDSKATPPLNKRQSISESKTTPPLNTKTSTTSINESKAKIVSEERKVMPAANCEATPTNNETSDQLTTENETTPITNEEDKATPITEPVIKTEVSNKTPGAIMSRISSATKLPSLLSKANLLANKMNINKKVATPSETTPTTSSDELDNKPTITKLEGSKEATPTNPPTATSDESTDNKTSMDNKRDSMRSRRASPRRPPPEPPTSPTSPLPPTTTTTKRQSISISPPPSSSGIVVNKKELSNNSSVVVTKKESTAGVMSKKESSKKEGERVTKIDIKSISPPIPLVSMTTNNNNSGIGSKKESDRVTKIDINSISSPIPLVSTTTTITKRQPPPPPISSPLPPSPLPSSPPLPLSGTTNRTNTPPLINTTSSSTNITSKRLPPPPPPVSSPPLISTTNSSNSAPVVKRSLSSNVPTTTTKSSKPQNYEEFIPTLLRSGSVTSQPSSPPPLTTPPVISHYEGVDFDAIRARCDINKRIVTPTSSSDSETPPPLPPRNYSSDVLVPLTTVEEREGPATPPTVPRPLKTKSISVDASSSIFPPPLPSQPIPKRKSTFSHSSTFSPLLKRKEITSLNSGNSGGGTTGSPPLPVRAHKINLYEEITLGPTPHRTRSASSSSSLSSSGTRRITNDLMTQHYEMSEDFQKTKNSTGTSYVKLSPSEDPRRFSASICVTNSIGVSPVSLRRANSDRQSNHIPIIVTDNDDTDDSSSCDNNNSLRKNSIIQRTSSMDILDDRILPRTSLTDPGYSSGDEDESHTPSNVGLPQPPKNFTIPVKSRLSPTKQDSYEEPLYQYINHADFTSTPISFTTDKSRTATSSSKTTPNNSSTNQLEIARQLSFNHRKLWCEQPEVIQSGVLGTISDQDRKLQEAMYEVLTSEASYLRSLNVLIEHFMDDPGMNPNLPDGRRVLDKRQHHVMFSNVREVKSVCSKFLKELQERQRESAINQNICDIILKYAEGEFSCYIPYCTNQVYQMRELTDLLENNVMFQDYLKRLETHKRCQNLSLTSFLLLPMQRITRLPLLVLAILNRTPMDHPNHSIVEKALRTVQKLVTACNDGARQMERTEELHLIHKQLDFKQMKPFPLVSVSRQLERKGILMLLQVEQRLFGKPRIKRVPVYVFVFTDYVLITKKKSNPKTGSVSYRVLDYASKAVVETVDKLKVLPNISFPKHVFGEQDMIGKATWAVSMAEERNAFLLIFLENSLQKSEKYIMVTQNETDHTRWLEAFTHPAKEKQKEDEKIYETWDCPQVQAVYDYRTQQHDELELMRGDIVKVYRKMADGWYEGERLRDLQWGWFPSNFTVEIENAHTRARNLKERHRLLSLPYNPDDFLQHFNASN